MNLSKIPFLLLLLPMASSCISSSSVIYKDSTICIEKTKNTLKVLPADECKMACMYSFGNEIFSSPSPIIRLEGKELQLICEIKCTYIDGVLLYHFKSTGFGNDFHIKRVGSAECDFLVKQNPVPDPTFLFHGPEEN